MIKLISSFTGLVLLFASSAYAASIPVNAYKIKLINKTSKTVAPDQKPYLDHWLNVAFVNTKGEVCYARTVPNDKSMTVEVKENYATAKEGCDSVSSIVIYQARPYEITQTSSAVHYFEFGVAPYILGKDGDKTEGSVLEPDEQKRADMTITVTNTNPMFEGRILKTPGALKGTIAKGVTFTNEPQTTVNYPGTEQSKDSESHS